MVIFRRGEASQESRETSETSSRNPLRKRKSEKANGNESLSLYVILKIIRAGGVCHQKMSLRRRNVHPIPSKDESPSSAASKLIDKMTSKNILISSTEKKRFFKRNDPRSPPRKCKGLLREKKSIITAPVMETPIWLSPQKFAPYVSTTVQKLKKEILEFSSSSERKPVKSIDSTPATLESLFAVARSQKQRKVFRDRFSSKNINEKNATIMYSELLEEHLKLQEQLRSVLTPELYNRLLVLRDSEESYSNLPSSIRATSTSFSPSSSLSSSLRRSSSGSSLDTDLVRRKLFDSNMSSSKINTTRIRLDCPKLELNEVQVGKFRVNRSTKYSLIIEFSRRDDDSTLSGITISVRFPEESSASQHLRAIMPVTSTLVVLGGLMIWSAFAIHKSFFLFSLILGAIGFRAHLQASPFAPYRGILSLRLDAKDIVGFKYDNRLTTTGVVNLETKKLELSWKVLDNLRPDSPRPDSPKPKKVIIKSNDLAMILDRKLRDFKKKSRGCIHPRLPHRNILRLVLRFCCPEDKKNKKKTKNKSSRKRFLSGPFADAKESIINILCPRGDENTMKDSIMENQMITIKFDEPLLPVLLKRFVLENEELIPHCESGMPGWSIFLTSYGFYYRRWMRHAFTIAVWLASLCMMSVGIFDLLRTFPAVRISSSLYLLQTSLSSHPFYLSLPPSGTKSFCLDSWKLVRLVRGGNSVTCLERTFLYTSISNVEFFQSLSNDVARYNTLSVFIT